MDDPSEFPAEPTNLKLLRRLVTTLLIVMIVGFIALIVMLVMRFPSSTPTNQLTDITLPAGITATAYTKGADWFAIVDDADTIRIYNQSDNSLRQTINIAPK
tara:strand:+ start:395 stop:700 length:306 start_codon:yes stop_codon:yes gene_type:complete